MHHLVNKWSTFLSTVFVILVLLCLPLALAAETAPTGGMHADRDRAAYTEAMDDASEAEAAQRTYVVGVMKGGHPPFVYINSDGAAGGFDIRILSLVAHESGFKLKYEPEEWIDIIPSLKAKKIDVIASGMGIAEERRQEVSFSIPYLRVSDVLVGRKDANLQVSTILRSHKSIGVVKGTPKVAWMKKNLIEKGKRIELVYYDLESTAIDDVSRGKIAVVALNEIAAKQAIKAKPLKILGTYGMPDTLLGYAVRKEDTAFLEILDSGLSRVMASLSWRVNKLKYFSGTPEKKQIDVREILSRRLLRGD